VAEGAVRLNLGCGKRPLDGYVNVDLADADVIHDLTQPLPFDAGVADEVRAIHVFEHFYRYECEAILADWVRVLKPGGVLVLELPCLDKVIQLFNWHIQLSKPVPTNLTLWGLYGDPIYRDPAMVHRWCYSCDELGGLMEAAGLTVSFKEATTHQPIRDMRAEGVK
jgi:predicted SAM-dependent methyltransferase